MISRLRHAAPRTLARPLALLVILCLCFARTTSASAHQTTDIPPTASNITFSPSPFPPVGGAVTVSATVTPGNSSQPLYNGQPAVCAEIFEDGNLYNANTSP